jgi:hypothetical protein
MNAPMYNPLAYLDNLEDSDRSNINTSKDKFEINSRPGFESGVNNMEQPNPRKDGVLFLKNDSIQ